MVTLGACSWGSGATRSLLGEYRLAVPARQLGQPVWLASFTTDELGGRLSRDGKRLLYAGNQKGDLELWIKDLTTGVPRRITNHVAEDTQPAWSPEERRVVFVSMREDVKGDLYLWEEGALKRLTDNTTADAFPVFSPDGRWIYFAAGPEGQSRIERLNLESGERTPITGWGATHPALSPDGRMLAYTQFTAGPEIEQGERGQIAIMRLADKQVRLITTPAYHAGFPAFFPDGKQLLFTRFTSGEPWTSLTTEAVGSLWAVNVRRARGGADPDAAMALAYPVTSGRRTVLFAQVVSAGIVFTSQRAGSLDIGLMPHAGLVPRLKTASEQLALALAQEDPRDQLLCLRRVQAMGRSVEASQAIYRASRLLRTLGEFDKAEVLLKQLVDDSPLVHGDLAYLAQIDLVVLGVEERVWRAARGGSALSPSGKKRALVSLQQLRLPDQLSPRIEAHRLMRTGDLLRISGKPDTATAAYEKVISAYPQQRAASAEAKVRLGQLGSRLGEPNLLTRYYLTLFDQYPDQEEWLRRAASAVLALQDRSEGRDPRAQTERLRALIEAHPDKPLFCSMAQHRLGELYETMGQQDLAIEAMHEVTLRYPKLIKESTRAAFAMGRLSLAYSAELRRKGRMSEALGFYSKALGAYERIVRTYEKGHEFYTRARVEYLRLSLLQAGQLERDGEKVLAEKRYRKILEFDPEMLQAHRKLIQFGVARGEQQKLQERYQRRVSKDPGDRVGHYGLGYLATYAEPLTADALERAAEHLQRAIELRPQSPFGHMTLGWVFEMRERSAGQTRRGFLEEAIDLYERAHGLNDAKIDVQTEADLLVNLCSSFAALGNGWEVAYDYCTKRNGLRLSFLSKVGEAAFHLTYGRTASSTGHTKLADRELEQALDLARDLKKKKLEAEVIARMALNAHLQGDYGGSNKLLKQAAAHYKEQGQLGVLAGLTRSRAYNLILAGKPAAALEQLAEARDLLEQHGVKEINRGTPIGDMGRTVSPFGFDTLDEKNADLGFQGLIYQTQQAWPEILGLLERRIKNRRAAFTQREDQELQHELLILQNHLALVRLHRGQEEAFHKTLQAAQEQLTTLQTEEQKGFVPSKDYFPIQVALALSGAEQVLASLAGGRAKAGAATAMARRLRELEQARLAVLKKDKVQLLPPRLALSLQSNLALLLFYQGFLEPTAEVSKETAKPVGEQKKQAPVKGKKSKAPPVRASGEVLLQELLASGAPFREAMGLLRQVMKQTDPAGPAPEDLREQQEAARQRGVLEPLFQPLTAMERLRWFILAALNLAEVSSSLTPREALEHHPSTDLLQELALLCVKHELGSLRFVISAEIASRRRSMQGMHAAVDGLLRQLPLMIEPPSRAQAELFRRRIFDQALELALEQKDLKAAVAFSEQSERRAFAEHLAASGPRGHGRAGAPVKALITAARIYREQLAKQDPHAGDEARQTWRKALDLQEQRVRQKLASLQETFPRVAALFVVSAFPEKALMDALTPRDVAVTALHRGKKIVLVSLVPGVDPVSVTLSKSGDHLRRLAVSNAQALEKEIEPVLAQLTRGARRVYLDLGRLSPMFAPERILPKINVVRLATLWELVDAHGLRNLAFQGGLVADPDGKAGAALGKALGFTPLAGKKLTLKTLSRPFEEAGILIWGGTLRFDGQRPTHLRLMLFDPEHQRLGDLRLSQALGLPLRGHLLVIPRVDHTPGQVRAERVALTRFIHAAGIPSLLLLDPSGTKARAKASKASTRSPDRQRFIAVMKGILKQLKKDDLAGAVQASGGGSPGLALFGHGGMEPQEAQDYAKGMLKKKVYAGAGAFNKRKLQVAIEELEGALRLMEVLQDFTFLDGALLYLGNAYTLLKDYDRAVPRMKRLIALRVTVIEEAKAKGKGVLQAQAKWVEALKTMGWLRMRNKQYDEALAVNKQAIDLYHEVKRPLMAQSTYDQRSIIAEKKGDMKEALTYAERTLETAHKALAAAPKSVSAKAAVSEAALRVAMLLRMRFSRYRDAMQAVGTALAQIPAVKPRSLGPLRKEIAALRQRAGKVKGKALEALKKQFKTLDGRRKQIQSAIENRISGLLELSRCYSARGEYSRAIKEAEHALALARASGLPLQATPLLEVVNNLFYTRSYSRAIQVANEGLVQSKDNELRQIQFYNAKGPIFAALGRTKDALVELHKALKIARRLGNPLETANTYNNLGNAHYLAGHFPRATTQFKRALAIDQAQEDRQGIAADHANLGQAEEKAGRSRQARAHYQKALKISLEIGARRTELKALAGLGRMSLAAGGVQAALKRFQRGLTVTHQLGLRSWSWRFLLLKGRALRGLQKVSAARTSLEQGLAMVEELPPRQQRALGAPRVEEQPYDLYDELIDLLAEQGEAEAAFDLAERLRARSLVDRLSDGAQRHPQQEAAQLMIQIARHRQELEATQGAIARAGRGAGRAGLEGKIKQLRAAITRQEEALSVINPRLPALISVRPWSFAKLKGLLPSDKETLLVSYIPTRRRLVIWILEGTKLRMKVVPVGREKLTRVISRMRRALSRFHQVKELSGQLYRWLLHPVLSETRADRLVIVPAGPLHVLPFAALHDGKDYVVAHHVVQYLPSVNALRHWSSGGKLGGPRLSFAWTGDRRRPLSYTVLEAEALSRVFPEAQVFQGPRATRARFRKEAPEAKLIHLATHGVFRPEAPFRSALELADGELPLLEVLGLKLKAALVILSACETGVGLLDGADGIIGLHRAFLAAGAQRVISSLWRVSDLGTALLMKHFFRGLARTSPARALQEAQNKVRQRFAHPAFWAGFRLDGALD